MNDSITPIYDKALNELAKFDYFTQSQVASLYRDFYDEFKEYFHRFSEENKVITSEVIYYFYLIYIKYYKFRMLKTSLRI